MTCGIYQIVNKINGKRYVGSSVNIERRWSGHRHRLRKGVATNNILLSSWLKYGEGSFYFEIIEECSRSELIAREQFHIDQKSEYNSRKIADSNYGRVIGDDEKKARSKAMIERHRKSPHLAEATRKSLLEMWRNESNRAAWSESISKSAKKSWSNPKKKKDRLSYIDDDYRKSVSIRNTGKSNPNYDDTMFSFNHIESGEVTMTKYEFYMKYGLDKSHITKLCKGKIKTHKGWSIKKAPEGA